MTPTLTRKWIGPSATIYKLTDDPATAVSLAKQGKLGSIRYTNFLSGTPEEIAAGNEAQWQVADRMIAACAAAKLRISLGLADLRNALLAAKINPYSAASWGTYWGPLLWHVAQRKNTVSGERYAADPALWYMAPCGEIEPPAQQGNLYSEDDIVAFYSRCSRYWKAATRVPFCTGGIGYVNYGTLWTDVWTKVFALPHVDICAVKTYPASSANPPSASDGSMLDFAVHTLAPYCAKIGKPWLDEEFGWEQSVGDANRAFYYATTFEAIKGAGGLTATVWNLCPDVSATSYDVSPETPAAWAALA